MPHAPTALRAAALALLIGGTVPAQAACKVQLQDLPVRMEGSRAIVTMAINGQQIPMMVDTGAYFSTLTKASAEQLGLPLSKLPPGYSVAGITGDLVEPRKTAAKVVRLAGIDIPGIEFLVGGNDMGMGSMGILGRNILSRLDVEYDLAHGMIHLVRADGCDESNMAYWAGEAPVSQLEVLHRPQEERRPILAKIKVNGEEVTALFDTGAQTLVSLHAAHDAGLKDAALHEEGVEYGAGAGRLKWWTANFDTVTIGDETVNHNRLAVSNFEARDNDMLVGIDFFLSHRIYVSQTRSRMFFTYNGGPVFALNVGARSVATAASSASQPAASLSADELFRRGSASMARKAFAAALADLDAACALEPGSARFHFVRAQANAHLGQWRKAREDLDSAVTLDPDMADARLLRASWTAGNADHAAALTDLELLDATLPPQSMLRWSLAETYASLGSQTLAIKQWTLWIANHGDDVALPNARDARCRARLTANVELDQAMADCTAAIDTVSDDAEFRSTRGWLLLRLNQPAKAQADFDRALRIKPDAAWPLYGRGLAKLRLGDGDGSRADLAAARKAEPKMDAIAKKAGFEPAP